jgi:hypothetical protein
MHLQVKLFEPRLNGASEPPVQVGGFDIAVSGKQKLKGLHLHPIAVMVFKNFVNFVDEIDFSFLKF